MPRPIDQLMQREMTRHEFMVTLGLGLASIMGFSTLLRMLTDKPLTHRRGAIHRTSGYGSTAYGGD